MIVVDKEIMVNASIEKAYGYILDPNNMVKYWPSVMEIGDVQPLPNGGYSARWVYKMAGIRLAGRGEHTKVVPNQHFVIETKGGVRSNIAWTFRSWEDATKVTLTVEYKMPIPILAELAEAIVTKMNDREGDLIMANLKAILEAT